MTRARRQDDRVRREGPNFPQRDRIVPMHDGFGTETANLLQQIIDERVVVVEEEDLHSGVPPPK